MQHCMDLMNFLFNHYESKKGVLRIFDCLNSIWGIEDIDIRSFLNTIDCGEINVEYWYQEWKKSFENIKLSIIIPTYNSHEFIQGTLRDLYKLIGNNTDIVEVILTDDNSTNPYYSYLLKEFPTLKILNNQETVRMGKNRNRGLNIAKGKWVTFLDHDDQLTQEAIWDILTGNFEDNVNIIRGLNRNACGVGSTEYYDYTCIELLHGVFYRREFLRRHHIEFSPLLNTSEDSFFNRRAFSISTIYYLKGSIIDKNAVYYKWRIHESSTMHKLYNGRDYTEEFYPEYVKACILAFDTELIPEKARILNFIFLLYHAEHYLNIWEQSTNFRKANIKILCGILLTLQDRYNIGYSVDKFMQQYREDYEKYFANDIAYFNVTEFRFTKLCFEIIQSIIDEQKKYLKELLLR